jgi:hypothetical protein
MDLVGVLSGITGVLLVWASLKNKHPLEAIKLALGGGDPNTAGPFTSVSEGTAPGQAPGGPTGPGLTDPGGPLEEYRNYDPNAPGLGGMPTI